MNTKKQIAIVLPFRKKSASQGLSPEETFKTKFHGVVTKPEVINLEEKRSEMRAADRRNVTRTVLSQFIGVFILLPQSGLKPVSVYDISDGGLSFDLPNESGAFKGGDSITMRIYLSHDTYFSFQLDVVNARPGQVTGMRRHGAIFQKNDDSYDTLVFFSKFLQSVSSVARKDHGDLLVGRIE